VPATRGHEAYVSLERFPFVGRRAGADNDKPVFWIVGHYPGFFDGIV
jgi:hypothetical protein